MVTLSMFSVLAMLVSKCPWHRFRSTIYEFNIKVYNPLHVLKTRVTIERVSSVIAASEQQFGGCSVSIFREFQLEFDIVMNIQLVSRCSNIP